MPNIREFQAPQGLGLNPTEIGVDATAGAARRVGAFYNQFGNATAELGNEKAQMWRTLGNDAGTSIKDAGDVAVKYEDHQQISHGSAEFATTFNNLTQQYNAALKNADPNDPSFVGKFNEEVVQPAMDEFKSGFSTENSQAWARIARQRTAKPLHDEGSGGPFNAGRNSRQAELRQDGEQSVECGCQRSFIAGFCACLCRSFRWRDGGLLANT